MTKKILRILKTIFLPFKEKCTTLLSCESKPRELLCELRQIQEEHDKNGGLCEAGPENCGFCYSELRN